MRQPTIVNRDERAHLRARKATLTNELAAAELEVRALEAAHNVLIAGKPERWEDITIEEGREVGVTTKAEVDASLQEVIQARAAADSVRRELHNVRARLNAAGG